jgi:asparagine synthase (glutamine-hydrolysing)
VTTRPNLCISKGLAIDAANDDVANDDWVLSFDLAELGRALPECVRWEELGPLRGFFQGVLFDREALAVSSQPNCSDAKLVLHAYAREGEAALARLRGSFVVAIVDGARGRAILARDPMGSHPLFYAEMGSCVLFAASPGRLLDWPGVSREFNRAAIADHLCHRWPDPHETFFRAVRRVPPGTRALLASGRLQFDRYWDPAPVDRPLQWLTAEEASGFDDVFERAVKRCLCHGQAGIFLSGGLDSISVAAVAADCARASGQSLPLALSVGYPDPECNEQERQAAVARDLGLRQFLIGFDEAAGSRTPLRQTLELTAKAAAPILNPLESAYLALARRARLDGVRTILTGVGGDDWLTVTSYYAADLIRRGAVLELAEFLGTLRRSYQISWFALVRNVLWRRGLRPLGGMALHRLLPGVHDAGRRKRQLAGDPAWLAPDPHLRVEHQDRAAQAMAVSDRSDGFYIRDLRTGLDHALISWDAEERHELGRQIGVRFLHPFYDPDLIELLCRTPPRLRNQGGRSKGLVRLTMAKRFPGLGLEHQRKVLARSFFQSLLLREGPALAHLAGDFPALSDLGIVDGPALAAFIREALMQPGPRLQQIQLRQIWQPINLEIWLRATASRGSLANRAPRLGIAGPQVRWNHWRYCGRPQDESRDRWWKTRG